MILTAKTNNDSKEPIIPDALQPYIKSTRLEGDHYVAETKPIPFDAISELLPDYPELREELTVEKYKLEIVIHNEGLTDALETVLENNPVYSIAWKGTNTVKRTSPSVADMADELGLSEIEVDGLFIEANKIDI